MKRFFTSITGLLLLGTAVFAQNRSIQNIDFLDVSVIEVAPNGNVWIGSVKGGCSGFTATTNTWDKFTTLNVSELKSDSLKAISLYPINGVGHSFMGTANGVAYKHGASWDTLSNLIDRRIVDMVKAPDHNFFVATPAGISVYDDTLLTHKSDLTTGNSNLPSQKITCLNSKPLTCNGFYAGTTDTGYFFTTDMVNFTHKTVANANLVDNRVNFICADANCTSVCVGTKGGLSMCDNTTCANFKTSDGLVENDITVIEKDCNGDLWVGTRNNGISIMHNNTFTSFTMANGLPSNKVTAITLKPGACEIYIGTLDAGVALLDSSRQVIDILNSVNEIQGTQSVSVYPQPAKNLLNVVLERVSNSTSISIADLQGRQILQQRLENARSSMDIAPLETGIYIYQITDERNVIKSGKISVLK